MCTVMSSRPLCDKCNEYLCLSGCQCPTTEPGDEAWDPDWERKEILAQRKTNSELRRALARVREELEHSQQHPYLDGGVQWCIDHISDVMMRGRDDE
jgi:hypothetical protein